MEPLPRLAQALEKFNQAEYFLAHEALEDLWRQEHGPLRKRQLQGLVQVAVAFYHYSTGNREGATSVLERGWRNLGRQSNSALGVDHQCAERLEAWLLALQRQETPPAPPHFAEPDVKIPSCGTP